MKLTKEGKREASKKVAEELKAVHSFFFTEYQGLKFKDLEKLRASLGELNAKFRVVKNSIVDHGLREAEMSPKNDALLKGPVGLVLGKDDDAIAVTKALVEFAKELPALKIKAGYFDSEWFDGAQVAALSKLGGKQEMRGAVASTLYGILASTAGVLQAPIRDFALTLKALEEKKQAEAKA